MLFIETSAKTAAHVADIFMAVAEKLTEAIPTDWQWSVFMIDFHRLGKHRVKRIWYQIKDLAQLLYSSEIEGVTTRDQLGFWRAYAGRPGGWNRFLGWGIRRKWRLYRRHNRGETQGSQSLTLG